MLSTQKECGHRSHVDFYRINSLERVNLAIPVFISREIASSIGTGGQLLVSRVTGQMVFGEFHLSGLCVNQT